jgi:hypothetical protein
MIRRPLRDFTPEERCLIRNWTWSIYGTAILIAVVVGFAQSWANGTRAVTKADSAVIAVGGAWPKQVIQH